MPNHREAFPQASNLFMPTRLTLTLPPEFNDETVEVDQKRFSIGRTPENDLMINDGSLSRRHAMIEEFGGHFNLTDCGSSNGTFVNGLPVTVSTELNDWDVLTFGGVGDILVRIEGDFSQAEKHGDSSSNIFARQSNHPPPAALSSGTNRFTLTHPLIAVAGAVLIVVISGLAILIYHAQNANTKTPIGSKGPKPSPNKEEITYTTPTPSLNLNTNTSNPDSSPNANQDSFSGSDIETYTSNVLKSISSDRAPYLTEKFLAAINAQVERYQSNSSSLAEQLRSIKRVLPQLSAAAKANGLRVPTVVYATLARIDRDGGRGDPVSVAGGLCPVLSRMNVLFGEELAADTLLSLAAMEEGADLQVRVTKQARGPESVTTIRSIWYLHEHNIISDRTYDFILRFMAIGVISQDPQKFGISAEPLVF
ncbi:MAG: hypothetical protein C5B55_01030 [Blastocatellia bacterium]|nr:MAG: hypothetical protein C5B55_01030 [Blastocatellia bacterium]